MTKDVLRTKQIFLKGICLIYMFAFGSLYIQIPGLYGENGVLPAHVQLSSIDEPGQCFKDTKTLLCFSHIFGLSVSHAMEFIALSGTILGFLGFVWQSACLSLTMILMWLFYLSLYLVGQTFLWFQWDILLLEIGFLSIFIAPYSPSQIRKYKPHGILSMWLIKWALFRLMFASGVVKLQSGCPTWWGLSALDIHFESQCIPTPLAWYAHQLPSWILKLGVVGTYMIEIAVPFLFFSPIRIHRIVSFYCQILLQLAIIMTGNYNFFNLLTMVMCISLLDDVHFGYRRVRNVSAGLYFYAKTISTIAVKWIGYFVIVYYTMAYFAVRLAPGRIESSVDFSKEDFNSWVSKIVPLSMVIGAVSLVFTIAESLTSAMFDYNGLRKTLAVVETSVYASICIILFGISLVPLTALEPQARAHIFPVFKDAYTMTQKYHITSSYGLFRRMTGVRGRPEVIIQGSNGFNGPWLSYEFPYKPGKLDKRPPFVAPHQPRLDWQMWFAALGSYHQNPWLISLSYRLLLGEKDVLNLLDSNSPWIDEPAKYIRAVKFTYQYTSYNQSSKNWWKRKEEGEYFPVYTVNHEPLLEYLKNQQLIGLNDKPSQPILASILITIRQIFTIGTPELTLFALLFTALLLLFSKPNL